MSGIATCSWPSVVSPCRLSAAGPADLAWEWLRRDPVYRQLSPCRQTPGHQVIVAAASDASIARWGCLNLPDAALPWSDTSILWSADCDPSVLKVMALPLSGSRSPPFDLARCGASARVVRRTGIEHVLLRDGAETLRIDVVSGSLLNGPVSLVHDFEDGSGLEPMVAALRRFYHLWRNGQLPARPVPAGHRMERQALALHVHDALAEGASIRDIGISIFGFERVRNEWVGGSLKSQCRRLIALARDMAAGGYLKLLR